MGVDQKHLAPRQHQAVHAGINGNIGGGIRAGGQTFADDLVDVLQMHRCCAPGAANHAIHITFVQQHGANQGQAPAHLDLGDLGRDALALRHAVVGLPKVAVAMVLLYIDDVVVHAFLQAQTKLFDTFGDDHRPAN